MDNVFDQQAPPQQQQYYQQQQDNGTNNSFDAAAASLQSQLVEYQHQQRDAAEKMQALQTYVQKYGARIDVHHKSKYTPQAEVPNLGTAVPSWYYLDGRGNKIFVQDMNFGNALQLAKGGRGMSAKQSHAFEQQETVIVVPKTKRNPAWHAEYLRRCEEYEAARRRLRTANHISNAGRVAIPEGHRLIGDGMANSHSAAFDSSGRKKGQNSLWETRQSQAKILGASTSPQKRITFADQQQGTASSSLVPYQQPQFHNTNTGILPAVMVDPNNNNNNNAQYSNQQQQQYFDPNSNTANNNINSNYPPLPPQQQYRQQSPSSNNNNNNAAALQEEAARLLAHLNQSQQQQL